MGCSQRLVIATRASRLAIWQAEHVRGLLQALYPVHEIELLTLSTRGDQILDRTLSKIGGKGLFIKELETALLDGRADLAVHSLKDVPVDMPPSFCLAAILKRDDPRDAFISNQYAALADLPVGAIVGTSSLRREAQIRARYPHLRVKPLRGNVDTRLAKLDNGHYTAIVLAAAGLLRLGLQQRIRTYLDPIDSLPAAGQGALGLEIRADREDVRRLLAPLSCPYATACALAERVVSRALGGSCQVPLAAYAEISGQTLKLRALVATPNGKHIVRTEVSDSMAQAEAVGLLAAEQLIKGGARDILTQLLSTPPLI